MEKRRLEREEQKRKQEESEKQQEEERRHQRELQRQEREEQLRKTEEEEQQKQEERKKRRMIRRLRTDHTHESSKMEPDSPDSSRFQSKTTDNVVVLKSPQKSPDPLPTKPVIPSKLSEKSVDAVKSTPRLTDILSRAELFRSNPVISTRILDIDKKEDSHRSPTISSKGQDSQEDKRSLAMRVRTKREEEIKKLAEELQKDEEERAKRLEERRRRREAIEKGIEDPVKSVI